MFTFLYYKNKEGDYVIAESTKTAQDSIENNSRNIKVVFFKLGTSNVHHKKKHNDSHRAVAMTIGMPLVLF